MKRFVVTLASLSAAALMLIPPAVAPASPEAHAAAYALNGKTNQGNPVRLTLASNLRYAELQFGYQVTCDNGWQFENADDLEGPTSFAAKRGHHISRVKFEGHDVPSTGTLDTPAGPMGASLYTTVTGNVRLDTGNATGRIEVTLNLANGVKCTTGLAPITYRVSIRR